MGGHLLNKNFIKKDLGLTWILLCSDLNSSQLYYEIIGSEDATSEVKNVILSFTR